MVKPEIIDKLSSELQKNNPFSEPLVVYILVQVRKLLEINNDRRFETLKFYCDWVLHSKLDRKGAKEVVESFEEIQEAVDAGDVPRSKDLCDRLFERVLSADNFRKQLTEFLSTNCICQDLCQKDDRWYEFLNCYGAVIHSVPLELKFGPSRRISRVVVTREEIPGLSLPDRTFLFALVWSPYKADGSRAMTHKVNFTVPQTDNN